MGELEHRRDFNVKHIRHFLSSPCLALLLREASTECWPPAEQALERAGLENSKEDKGAEAVEAAVLMARL